MAKLFWEIYAAVGTLGILAWPEQVLSPVNSPLPGRGETNKVWCSSKKGGGWGRREGESILSLAMSGQASLVPC